MAVYRRGYQRYRGATTGPLARFLVLPRFAWARLLEQKIVVVILALSVFWPLACAGFIYVSNHADLWPGLGNDLTKFLAIDGSFFHVFMATQATVAVILSAFAGPNLIAPDLANNALPLYFSRPLSRSGYVLARMFVLVGLLSPITWVPGLLLFAMQTGLAGWDWFRANWTLGVAVFAGFVLWIVLVALVAMACSAYVRWRIVAGALVLGFFFILAGASELINNVLRVDWGYVLNPVKSIEQIWRAMLGVPLARGPEAMGSAIAVLTMAGLLLAVLYRKLRPVEVIR